jgi:hypothetical protein
VSGWLGYRVNLSVVPMTAGMAPAIYSDADSYLFERHIDAGFPCRAPCLDMRPAGLLFIKPAELLRRKDNGFVANIGAA